MWGGAHTLADLADRENAIQVRSSANNILVDEIEQTLDRALELVEETNGRSIEPQLLEERARLARLLEDAAACDRELREAHRLYTEMGATGHAKRLAEELGL